MFTTLLLTVHAQAATRLTAADGVYVHAAVLQTVTRQDATIGRELHDIQRHKPLSLAILPSGTHSAQIQISWLGDQALDYTNILLRSLADVSDLQLGDQVFSVENVQLSEVATWSDLIAGAAKRIRIQFLTPTAITRNTASGGRYNLLYPEPTAVFNGLGYRWRDLGGPPLENNLDDALNGGGCIIARHKLQTTQFKTRNRIQIGFTGYAVYDCRAAETGQRNAITALARLAQFSGIGYQTGRGMGAIRVEVE